MQTIDSIASHAQTLVSAIIAAILAYGAGLLTALRLTPSQKKKLEAEARQIDLQMHIEAGDLYMRMMRELRESNEALDRIRDQRDNALREADAFRADAARAAAADAQLDRIKRALPAELLTQIFAGPDDHETTPTDPPLLNP